MDATATPLSVHLQGSAPITSVDALRTLGADPGLLTAHDRRELDERGFVLWERVLPPDLVGELAAAVDAIAEREGRDAGHDYQQEPGALRLGNLPNKAACFDAVWTHPRYLAAVRHVIGDAFALDSLSFREPLMRAGEVDQWMHQDGIGPVVDAVVMLDDFTWESGAPRIIPGSHRWTEPLPEAARIPVHPQEVVVAGPAGSMVVFNGNCWHGGRRNRNGVRRRGLFPYMVGNRAGAGAYQRKHLGPELAARLTPAKRWLLALDEPA